MLGCKFLVYAVLWSCQDHPTHVECSQDYCNLEFFFTVLFMAHHGNGTGQFNDTRSLKPTLGIYVDGSKRGCYVGRGFFIGELVIKVSFRLPADSSVLQAEYSAIRRSSNWYLRTAKLKLKLWLV